MAPLRVCPLVNNKHHYTGARCLGKHYSALNLVVVLVLDMIVMIVMVVVTAVVDMGEVVMVEMKTGENDGSDVVVMVDAIIMVDGARH